MFIDNPVPQLTRDWIFDLKKKEAVPQSEIFRRVYGDYAWNSPTTVTFPTNIVFFGIPQINDHSSNHILYVH